MAMPLLDQLCRRRLSLWHPGTALNCDKRLPCSNRSHMRAIQAHTASLGRNPLAPGLTTTASWPQPQASMTTRNVRIGAFSLQLFLAVYELSLALPRDR